MIANRGLLIGLVIALAACGQDKPQTAAPGQGVAVTYYPTATRPFPLTTAMLVQLPPTETPLPTSVPAPIETVTLSPPPVDTPPPVHAQALAALPVATLGATPTEVPTEVPTVAPTGTPIVAPIEAPTAVPVVPIELPTLPPSEPPRPRAPVSMAAAAQVAAPSLMSGGSSCASTSPAQFDLVPVDGSSDTALTDQNADLRLSVLGIVPVEAPLQLVDYSGATDGNAPRLHGMFQPSRIPQMVRVYKRRDWNWDRASAPPYGTPGGANNDWPVSTVDFATTSGEAILIPQRGTAIYGNNIIGMVLYASEQELTIIYTRQDAVGTGYVVHMQNLCVDPNLVALYRAQLAGGKHASGQLPGIRGNQTVGTALTTLTVAIRDRGAFYDPRSRKDWWQAAP